MPKKDELRFDPPPEDLDLDAAPATSRPPVCFVDIETTGLDPVRHEVWEVALITPDDRERVWQFPIVELAADPIALDIGRYWERRASDPGVSLRSMQEGIEGHVNASGTCDIHLAPQQISEWAELFRDLTAGLHLCGAVVSFDEERLRHLILSHGLLPRWHYHLVDVEALAAGWIAGGERRAGPRRDVPDALRLATPPWDSEVLSHLAGVHPDKFDRHTALGDARWAKAIFEAVFG